MSRTFKIVGVSSSVLIIWILTAPFLADYLVVRKPLAKSDVILILGGSSAYVERANKAAMIYAQGVSTKIVLTDDGEKAGWSTAEERNPPYVDLAKGELIKQGVPAEAIEILTPGGSGTIYEAAAFREIAKANGVRSILIVTSEYHTRRAIWVFEREFEKSGSEIEIGIEPAVSGHQNPAPMIWWLSPSGWRMVAGEYVKILYYSVFY